MVAAARRANASVAADRMALEVRARWAAESAAPENIFRRFEAIEAAIYALARMIEAAS